MNKNLDDFYFIEAGELVVGIPRKEDYNYVVASTGALGFSIEMLQKADRRITKEIERLKKLSSSSDNGNREE